MRGPGGDEYPGDSKDGFGSVRGIIVGRPSVLFGRLATACIPDVTSHKRPPARLANDDARR